MPEVNQHKEELRRAVRLVIESGYHLDSDAFDALQRVRDPYEVVSRALTKAQALSEKTFVLTADLLSGLAEEEVVVATKKTEEVQVPTEAVRKIPRVDAKEIGVEIKILRDAGERVAITDFLSYFKNRFERLRDIVQSRPDVQDALSIADACTSTDKDVKMVGMVRRKVSSKGKIFLDFEDLENSVRILVPSQLAARAQLILLDQILCITARRWKGMFIAQDVIWPDIPDVEPNHADAPILAALLSDLHIGSKMFAEGAFNQFIQWLRGEYGSATLREVARSVKYVIINGDIVDGVGIYPGQKDELLHDGIYDQYEKAAAFIGQIPDHIKVIITSGNHDATNRALPHAVISKEHAKALYDCRELFMAGNPALVSLHGVKILVSHGEGLDDIIATVPGFSYGTVGEAMRLMLQSRHLAPVYGKSTGILPLPEDPLVIDEKPDVFQTGHVHIFHHNKYRRTIMLNSGSWQDQTSYQRRMGLNPTVGLASLLNLQTLDLITIDFTKSL